MSKFKVGDSVCWDRRDGIFGVAGKIVQLFPKGQFLVISASKEKEIREGKVIGNRIQELVLDESWLGLKKLEAGPNYHFLTTETKLWAGDQVYIEFWDSVKTSYAGDLRAYVVRRPNA